MIDNTEVSTIKKIPLINVPQKFKELLKKFEYVESGAITVVSERSSRTVATKGGHLIQLTSKDEVRSSLEKETKETKVEDTSCLSTEQQIAFEKFKQGGLG